MNPANTPLKLGMVCNQSDPAWITTPDVEGKEEF